MGINSDSSKEEESFISSDDGNNDGSSIDWTEINSIDENDIDDFEEVCRELEEHGWSKGKKLYLEQDEDYCVMNGDIDEPFYWIP